MQTVRVAALANRVPSAVLTLELAGAAVASGCSRLDLAVAVEASSLCARAGLVCVLLLITFDLDRPMRGFVEVPDTPLDPPACLDGPPARRCRAA